MKKKSKKKEKQFEDLTKTQKICFIVGGIVAMIVFFIIGYYFGQWLFEIGV